MENMNLDKEISEALKMQVSNIGVSDCMKRKITQELRIKAYETKQVRKHFNIKKTVAIGIACMVLSATVLIAGGQVTTLVSHSNPFAVCKDYSKLNKQEKKLGYKVNIIEKYSNGYVFEDMEVGKVKGLDDTGSVVETYKEMVVDYTNELGEKITLVANQRDVGREFREPVQTLQYGNTTLYYYLDTYKFVPEDYVLTEEDKKNLERDDYEISSGAEEVEISKVSSVQWEKDDVSYSIFAFNTKLTADELLKMASETLK